METLPAPPPEFVAAADLLGASEPDGAWRREARPGQLPPEGDWFIWLLLAGRGFGKTWVGARWLAEQAMRTPGEYAVIGRSEQDTRETCIEGQSGLLGAQPAPRLAGVPPRDRRDPAGERVADPLLRRREHAWPELLRRLV
jgi:phage terminase large subunit-like protein